MFYSNVQMKMVVFYDVASYSSVGINQYFITADYSIITLMISNHAVRIFLKLYVVIWMWVLSPSLVGRVERRVSKYPPSNKDWC